MSHSLIVISLADIKPLFMNKLDDILYRHIISIEETDDLYDWLVNQALMRLLGLNYSGKVKYHYRHDVYLTVYSELGHSLEVVIKNQIDLHKLNFLHGETVKTLVAGDCLIIARGNLSHARY